MSEKEMRQTKPQLPPVPPIRPSQRDPGPMLPPAADLQIGPREHKVEVRWRETDAFALEERVRAINEWLDHSVDLEEMLATEDDILQALRGMMGLVRTKRDDLQTEADRLRASIGAL